ncbi:hypothetical protein [Umezawaea sp. Da 62-37]|uniref:hypothetical protein n=1 Tax=Umezawaea sp. Da 62-37 TaxID=3075927 RepID=UPI0028F6C60E|nr:hypothetical protein [Umezawaea sp. Da 62-37]WNV85328.1 hypothetical protein RM788_45635 [Umezawaea sp. Da 62-37]
MSAITAANFPTPDLALRTTDPAQLARVRAFAVEQASAAEETRARLATELPRSSTHAAKVAVLGDAYADLVRWRHRLALRAPGRLGQGLALDASRFTKTITEGGANYDRLGYLGRLRDGSVWESGTQTYRGGHDTPAHRLMLAYGQAVVDRFAHEHNTGDVLRNTVTLPGGDVVVGNSLVRGAAARQVAAVLMDRVTVRGHDTARFEIGGEPLYAVTAADDARSTMYTAAVALLAATGPHDVRSWQAARYLLFQAPLTKKGSDAVIRTFLVAVGALLFDRPPTLDHDVDLRCVVLGQEAATTSPLDPVVVTAP